MDDALPLVSVVTVCVDAERTIGGTIESVLRQRYPRVEYIIVDGGSTDGTMGVIAPYRGRLAAVVSERDSGISEAFNKGIGLARGEIVHLLNAGDRFEGEGTVEAAVELLRANPEAAFVHGDIRLTDPRGSRTAVWKGDPHYGASLRHVMRGVNHPTMFVRKPVYERHGLYDLRWKVAMDYDWLLRIDRAGERGVYGESIVVRMEGGGLSDTRRVEAFREVRDISILHGLHPLPARCYYVLRLLKHSLLRSLGRR